MRYIATITRLTFHEACRRQAVLLASALSVLFVVIYAIGFHEIISTTSLHGRLLVETYNFLLLAGLYVVHFLTITLSIFVSVDGVSGEIASHTVQAMLTRPMRRSHFLVGKWIGYTAMISLYAVALSSAVLAVTYLESHYLPTNPSAAIEIPVLVAVVVISLSMLLGTRLAGMTNGVALFVLYGLAFIGGWVEQLGSFMQSDGAMQVGIATSLAMPAESLWRRESYLLQPSSLSSLNISPFSAVSVPSETMLIYGVAYSAVALLMAVRMFNRRDM